MNPSHSAIYHWSGLPRDLFLPSLLDFLIAWLLLTALLLSARSSTRWRVIVWATIVLFLPAVALKSWAFYSGTTPAHSVSRALWLGGSAGWLLAVLCHRPSFTPIYDRGVEFLSILLAFMAIPGAILLCQATWFGWQARHVNNPEPLTPSRSIVAQGARPRIIWILLDELSYQQVYGNKIPGLQLPAFTALAQQATVFTKVKPAGMFTESVVPELLTGQSDDLVRSSAQGELLLRDPGTLRWRVFDQHHTVFEDALGAGYRTAVVGWYNPYCRIMPQVLDSCFWTLSNPVGNGMLPDAGIWSNMLRPLDFVFGSGVLQRLAARLFSLSTRPEAREHIEDFQRLSTAADNVLSDPSVNFVLLHLPIPHPPGIYSRTTHKLTDAPSSYIDNLTLADSYLAHIRSVLQRTGQWDTSTLILMGDHSWRIPLWRSGKDWTADDEKASHGGQFDTRPVYLVRLPGQQNAAQISAPFPALATRKLLDSLLSRTIFTTKDLNVWAEQNSPIQTTTWSQPR